MTATARISVLMCRAGYCENPALHISGLCDRHRRALKLTAAIQDAILEFMMTPDRLKPGTRNDKKIIEAGDHFAHGMYCLIGTLFNTEDVIFEAKPIVAQMSCRDTNVPRWRVQFKWIAHNGNLLADDSDVDLDDDPNDDLAIGNDDE
ncbi:hypothetical protein DAVIS_04692 [Mycobacterium marinum]|uniref:Uncharacterized protein n=1 Tax=Mycobacterium marinum TaxID=1781 RepID=A0A3E2MQV0_MYCMR|nr:hypothetical protein [Mycobacterium marinum]RFZ35142.1 hypothetical protein DAVIS_04692 [Mycobacterium marinum]